MACEQSPFIPLFVAHSRFKLVPCTALVPMLGGIFRLVFFLMTLNCRHFGFRLFAAFSMA
jgi:hypothetical protein